MYDWIGPLADNPMHFRLCLQPGVTIQPAELLAHVDRVLQMEVVNTAILMDREDNEISFHRFSAAEVSEENSTSNPTNIDLPSLKQEAGMALERRICSTSGLVFLQHQRKT